MMTLFVKVSLQSLLINMIRLNRDFIFATIANCFFFINFSSFFLLPLFLDNLQYDKFQIGVLMGSFGVSSILLTHITSTLIDQYGKRLSGIVALVLMIISSSAYCITTNFYLLFALRIIQGASFSVFFNSTSAIASDNLDKGNRKQGLSVYFASTIFPYFIGPFFGEIVIINYGFIDFFIFSSSFSVIALIIIFNVSNLQATKINNDDINFSDFFKIISDQDSRKYLLTNFLSSSGFGIIMNFVAIFLKEKGLKSGLFFLIYSCTVTFFRLFLSNYISEKNLFSKVLLMLIIFSSLIFFFPTVNSVEGIIIFSFLFSSSYALIYPFLSALLIKENSIENSGRLFGALNSTFGLGVHLMTFLFGYLIHVFGFNIGFQVCSLFILIFAIYILWQERKG